MILIGKVNQSSPGVLSVMIYVFLRRSTLTSVSRKAPLVIMIRNVFDFQHHLQVLNLSGDYSLVSIRFHNQFNE